MLSCLKPCSYRSVLGLWFLAICTLPAVVNGDEPLGDITIEFSPMMGNMDFMMDAAKQMGSPQAGGRGGGGMRLRSSPDGRPRGNGGSQELNDILASMLAMSRGHQRIVQGPGGPTITGPYEGPEEPQILTLGGAPFRMNGPLMMKTQMGANRLAGSLLRDLFPRSMLSPFAQETYKNGYLLKRSKCVSGHNTKVYPDSSVEDCMDKCKADPSCKAFEYGVWHKGDSQKYKPRDCIPNDSADSEECNGRYYNLDLYIKEDKDVAPAAPPPQRRPDSTMMDILKGLDRSFASEMMPLIQKGSQDAEDSDACSWDIKQKCNGASSHLHCLGQNSDTISEACHQQVGKSVPFRCSKFTDQFCDVLQAGVLDCLSNHLPQLDDECRDAVLATHHVFQMVNTQKASVRDPSTGITTHNTPDALLKSLGLAPSQEASEGWLDGYRSTLLVALIALGVYLYLFTNVSHVVHSCLQGRGAEGVGLLSKNMGIELLSADSYKEI